MSLNLQDVRWAALFPHQQASQNFTDFKPIHHAKTVLVTGAGGSIGSALSRAIHALGPRTLVLLDSSEQNLYYIHRELSAQAGSVPLVPVLGSVADETCVGEVFKRFHPEVVYHAAALKHVPLGEMNPFAVVQNNIVGTSVVANVACVSRTERLVMISTDKSVNPRSIMGASKRFAEMLLQTITDATTPKTSIRLGNVLGSEGSVVPLFLDQIARGGPVTVADPDVARYFLTMEATVQRIFSTAASCPAAAAVAIPVMGDPVKIADLARFLIAQASKPEVAITYTGLRPGDKLQEEFVAADEAITGEASDGIQWVTGPNVSAARLITGLADLAVAMNERNLARLLSVLTCLVPEYQPSPYLLEQVEAAANR
jgi:FlaA1/EpsC-like NDP-sugar epimerase